MKGYAALRRVKKACYELSGSIEEGMLYDEYHSMLKKMAKDKFPSNSVASRMEHVIHWILFDAGFETDEIGNYEKSVTAISKKGFNAKNIEKGINEYKDYIQALVNHG